MAHVQYVEILTLLQGFLVIFLYLVWFSLRSSLFFGRQWSHENFAIFSVDPQSYVRILIYYSEHGLFKPHL